MRWENKVRIIGLMLLAVFAGYEYPAVLGDTLYFLLAHLWLATSILAFIVLAVLLWAKGVLSRHWRPLLAVFVVLMLVGLFSEATRSLEVSRSLEVDPLRQLPQIRPEGIRVVPLAVAYSRAEAVFSSATHRPGSYTLLVYRDGRPYWQIPVVPERGWNYMSRRMEGFIEIPAYTFHLEPRLIKADFRYGFEHFHDVLWAAYIKAGAWGSRVELADSFINRASDGSYWIVVPLSSWRLEKGIYSVPRVTGILLVCMNGTVVKLGIREALSNPLTRGGPLVPEWMARWYVERLNYRRGLLNMITAHRDMFELRDPSSRNKQPWLVLDSQDRLWWLFAAEPYGRGGGVSRIFLVNARDPSIRVYEYRVEGGLLIGPRKAADLAKASLPSYDWERYSVEEPIPLIVNGTLYWRVVIIPRDASTIDSIVLVNSRTGDVFHVKNDEELESFLKGLSGKSGQQGGLEELLEKLRRMIAEEKKRLEEMEQLLKELEKKLVNGTSG